MGLKTTQEDLHVNMMGYDNEKKKRKTVIFVANRKAARSIARHKGKLIGVKKMNAVEASKNKQRHNRWGTKKSTHHIPAKNQPMSWFAKNWREMATKDVERQYMLHRNLNQPSYL